jgi:hypothetical protein
VVPVTCLPPMRAKFAFRARFRLSRHYRGRLPLRRALFHRRLRSLRVLRDMPEMLAED